MNKEVFISKSWVLTNLFSSIVIISILFLTNLFLEQIELDSRRFIQAGLGIVIFFLLGMVFSLPHYLYSCYLLRKNHDPQHFWRKIRVSMLLPYLILYITVVSINVFIYGNPLYELPNIFFLGILILHFTVGFFIWRYFTRIIYTT